MSYSIFVSCPKGLEYLLEEEMKNTGLEVTQVNPQGVYGHASIAIIYKICLWSRIANRVQLVLCSGQASDEQSIISLCKDFPWQSVFSADKTIAVEFHGQSRHIRNTMYGAQLVKDGIVDYFKALDLPRPSVDKKNPDIRIHAYLKQERLTLSFDLCGYSLHQRGYRAQAGAAPLKENVAAALLVRAKWPSLAAQNYSFQDPCCGSGTLVIEAAMMAANIAPGLLRKDQSLQHWTAHQQSLWASMRQAAIEETKPVTAKFIGSDLDHSLVQIAKINAEKAGVSDLVEFKQQALEDCRPEQSQGLLLSNPPYGERLSEVTALVSLYQQIGHNLYHYFQGWQAAIFTSKPLLAKAIGLRSNKQYKLYNGAEPCQLYCFDISESNHLQHSGTQKTEGTGHMLVNRLKKNDAHLKKWAKKNQIACYRLYDADLPEYAFALDRYNDYLLVQEYKAPAEIAEHKVEKRALEMLQAIPLALDIRAENMIVKERARQRGVSQYNKLASSHKKISVAEGKARLLVNLYDYIDTGLFLDHRPIRLKFESLKPGTRFLNCFAYTAAASVHAAIAGAVTTSVDMSKTYIQWAKDNFEHNGLSLQKHQFIQADCLQWLNSAQEQYDVIFLDPPSFSNSKRMEESFDIQRDHVALIDSTMKRLASDGLLYFSTNLRKFKLSQTIEDKYRIKNITQETIDVDFKRSKNIHHCYEIRKA